METGDAVMKYQKPIILSIVVIVSGMAVGAFLLAKLKDQESPGILDDTFTVERTDYAPPPVRVNEPIADDRLGDKVTKFDPKLIDRRPLGAWDVNLSEAVIKLDAPMLLPEIDDTLMVLHPSYEAALAVGRKSGKTILPSVNLLDGKAKQFDDGLYSALDQAYYKGIDKIFVSHIGLIRRLLDKVGISSPAAPYLAAGLSQAGEDVKVKDEDTKNQWISSFEQSSVRSKPIGFYTWNKTLGECFRFLRYFQGAFRESDQAIVDALVTAFKADPQLLADYRQAIGFYFKLSNPTRDVSISDLLEGKPFDWKKQTLSFFPEATSKETELFEKMYPLGLPENTDLMRDLINGIRSGKVDLRPKPESGWYDYQVHALETMLMPQNGEGSEKLLLTKAYKERMVEAFKALMTKRRETHSRNAKTAAAAPSAVRPKRIEPRLRLEPCPAYYHRTARAYAFLEGFLVSRLGESALKSLHGLKEGGERSLDLLTELRMVRDLFYGFYLLSCEDIGLEPKLLEGETVDVARSETLANDWLKKPEADPDTAIDTRVAVPVYLNPMQRKTRLWMTLGVRLAKLEASYERGPKISEHGKGEWKPVEAHTLGRANYLIAVDEFAEVELPRLDVLNRSELRKICDEHKTKEAIVNAIAAGKR
jgi:hypothetical protein